MSIDISHCFTSDISVFFRTLLNKTLEQFSHAPATYGIFRCAIKAGNKIKLADSCQSSLAFSSVFVCLVTRCYFSVCLIDKPLL